MLNETSNPIEKNLIIGLIALVGGIVSVTIVALPLEVFLNSPPALAGLVEEPTKVIPLLIIAFLYPGWLESKKKCLIFGGLAGLGFAFTENLFYYFGALAIEKTIPSYLIYIRTLLSLPAHVIWSAIVASGILYIAARGREGVNDFIKFLVIAIILHSLWNSLASLEFVILLLLFSAGVLSYIYIKVPDYPLPDNRIGILKLPTREILILRSEKIYGREDFKNDLEFEDLGYITKKENGKYQFKISRVGDEFFIQDNESSGGTLLDGVDIKGMRPQKLKVGSKITLPGGLDIEFFTKADIEDSMKAQTYHYELDTELMPMLIFPEGGEITIKENERDFGRSDFRHLSNEGLNYISRKHFRIMKLNYEYYIEDLNSRNGTKVNGEEIKGLGRKTLEDGDEILVGGIKMVFSSQKRENEG